MKKLLLLSTVILAAITFSALPSYAEGKSVIDFFPENLVDANGNKVSRDSLKGKTVGIYFSAEWCPPCRQFTPLLVEFRDKNKKDFEVVFVSSDYSVAEKKEYMSSDKMKWPTIDGVNSPDAALLAQMFQVQGYPTLIIIAPNGQPLTPYGREFITNDPDGALKIWQDATKKIDS